MTVNGDDARHAPVRPATGVRQASPDWPSSVASQSAAAFRFSFLFFGSLLFFFCFVCLFGLVWFGFCFRRVFQLKTDGRRHNDMQNSTVGPNKTGPEANETKKKTRMKTNARLIRCSCKVSATSSAAVAFNWFQVKVIRATARFDSKAPRCRRSFVFLSDFFFRPTRP